MKRWLIFGALGVVFLLAGVWLITSKVNLAYGQAIAAAGVVMILISAFALRLAARWAVLRTKGRFALFGAGIVGRLLVVVAILVAVVIGLVYFLATPP